MMNKKGMAFSILLFDAMCASANTGSSDTWIILCSILSGIILLLIIGGYFCYKQLRSEITVLKKESLQKQEAPLAITAPILSFDTPPEYKIQEKSPSSENNKKYKLLVIEDHKEIRLYLKILFSNEYILYTAENGEEGLKMAQEELPDLIITDVMMPVMNGFDCCKQLKENLNTCHIPVILLTALIDDENVMKGIELGADDYILKPFKPEILKTKVKRLIKSREELKEIYTRLLTPSSTDPETNKKQEEELRALEDPFIVQIVEIINENMQSPDFNVRKLADMMDTSQPTLYRRVKSITNFTISEFIRGIRLKRSAELLRTRKYNVQEVAEMVGYNDLATFRKHFVDFYGTTPSTYNNKTTTEN